MLRSDTISPRTTDSEISDPRPPLQYHELYSTVLFRGRVLRSEPARERWIPPKACLGEAEGAAPGFDSLLHLFREVRRQDVQRTEAVRLAIDLVSDRLELARLVNHRDFVAPTPVSGDGSEQPHRAGTHNQQLRAQ